MKKYVLVNFADDNKKKVGFYLVVLNTEHEYLEDYADDARQYIAQSRETSADSIRILDYTFFGSELDFLEGYESTESPVKQKTAKDLAWDKERQKLKSQIWNLRKHLSDANRLLQESEELRQKSMKQSDDLQHIVEELLELNKMSHEDLRALIDNKKKVNEAADLLKFMSGGIGSQFYI